MNDNTVNRIINCILVVGIILVIIGVISVLVYREIDTVSTCRSNRLKYTDEYNNMFKTGIVNAEVLRNYHMNEASCYLNLNTHKEVVNAAEQRIQSDIMIIHKLIKKE